MGQLFAWGILYYAFTALSDPMRLGLDWSRPVVNGGLSLGLLTWGVLAFPVGRWIYRNGGRGIMAVGSAVGGLSFAALGLVNAVWQFYVVWIGIGSAMAALLYEPAFAVVTAAFGSNYRRGIVLITLIGGLASTAFIPLAYQLNSAVGWRQSCLSLGVALASLGLPLHYFGLRSPGTSGTKRQSPKGDEQRSLTRDIRSIRFLGLAGLFTAHTASFSGLIFLLIPILSAQGATPGELLASIALIGPMQVIGRLLLVTRGGALSALRVGLGAMILLICSILVLLLCPMTRGWMILFAVLFGAGNGVMTIVKGTSVGELFGLERYAELSGALSAPAVLAKAAAPLALSWIWSVTGDVRTPLEAIVILLMLGVAALRLAQSRSVAKAA